MEWHLNDLSLAGQFETSKNVEFAITEILELRQRRRDLAGRLYCSRGIGDRPATGALTLRKVVMSSSDRDFRNRCLSWINAVGPFWTDARAQNTDDLFYFDGEDVTDQGLGEAARRHMLELQVEAFSFPNVERFVNTPLQIVHGLLEAPLGTYELANCRGCKELETRQTLDVSSWSNMLEIAANFENLQFGSHLIEDLKPKPFQQNLAERLLLLLSILNRLSSETDVNGTVSEKGQILFQKHFVGKHAWFSPEEKSDLLTFPDPDGGSKKISCHWHGKTKMGGQTRIHYEWPRPDFQKRIKIAYIGTKLTKW